MASQEPPGGRLNGRIAVVTGATRGIGRAVAETLAREGATIVAIGRDRAALETLDDTLKAATGRSAVLVDKDLTKFETIDHMGQALFDRYGKLDILVGAAGILGQLSPTGHIPPKVWDDVFAINVTANWRLLRSFDLLLRQSDAGRALFVTCAQARSDAPFWGAYGASKAALERMVQIYAREVRDTKVRVNLIDPGTVATKLRQRAFPGEEQDKLPQPADVAPAFVDLLTPACTRHGEIVIL